MKRLVLVCEVMGGNWFDVAAYCNKHNLAEYVIGVSEMSGHYTRVMYRMPEDVAVELTNKGIIKYTAKPEGT